MFTCVFYNGSESWLTSVGCHREVGSHQNVASTPGHVCRMRSPPAGSDSVAAGISLEAEGRLLLKTCPRKSGGTASALR